VRVIGRERITVPAGTFDTIVLQPMIRTKGIFSEKGEARIWLTDDASRVMVKMTAKVAFGTLTMALTSARPGADRVIVQAWRRATRERHAAQPDERRALAGPPSDRRFRC
jgi:hypothetical protein